MFDEAHTKLEVEEIAMLLDILNKQIDGSVFDPLETTILAIDLSFYPGCRFLHIADYMTMPPIERYVFQKMGKLELIILDWNYKTIQGINRTAPISLNDDNILDYIRFYFNNVKGRYGKFIICETANNIHWKEEPPSEIKRSLNQSIAPLQVAEKSKKGAYAVNAFMMLKDVLFAVQIYVLPNGDVSMSDHKIIMENIPVLDPVFHQ